MPPTAVTRLLTCAVLWSLAASAFPYNDTRELSAYLESPEHQKAVNEAARQFDEKLGRNAGCDSPGEYKRVKVEPVFAPKTPWGEVFPKTGWWVERFSWSRCGKSVLYNVNFVAKEGSEPGWSLAYTGETLALPIEVPWVLKSVFELLREHVKQANPDFSCDKYSLEELSVSQAPAGFRKPWQEVWRIRGCNRDFFAQLDFEAKVGKWTPPPIKIVDKIEGAVEQPDKPPVR